MCQNLVLQVQAYNLQVQRSLLLQRLRKVKATKKSLTIKWSKVKGVSGYEIQVATDKNFKKNKKSILVKKQKTTSAKIKKLKSKKKYYVRVRTYKVVGRKKVYSSWINGKATKTK